MKIRVSKTGFALCVVYGAIAIPLLVYAYGIVDDLKGAYVIRQVALLPAIIVLGFFSTENLPDMPAIFNNIIIFLIFSFAIVYIIGWICGVLASFIFSKIYASLTTKRPKRAPNLRFVVSRHLLATAFFFGLN